MESFEGFLKMMGCKLFGFQLVGRECDGGDDRGGEAFSCGGRHGGVM